MFGARRHSVHLATHKTITRFFSALDNIRRIFWQRPQPFSPAGDGDSLDRAAQACSMVNSTCECPAAKGHEEFHLWHQRTSDVCWSSSKCIPISPRGQYPVTGQCLLLDTGNSHGNIKQACKWTQLWNPSTRANSYQSETTKVSASGHVLPTSQNGFFCCCCCETS